MTVKEHARLTSTSEQNYASAAEGSLQKQSRSLPKGRAWLRSLDKGVPANRKKARAAFAREYQTLAALRDELLDPRAGHLGKYVLIHGNNYLVCSTLDEAEKLGYAEAAQGLFLTIEIDPDRFEAYLAP